MLMNNKEIIYEGCGDDRSDHIPAAAVTAEETEEEQAERNKLMQKIDGLSRDIERFNLAEYVTLLNSPRRFLTINFAGGVARGLGFALGATFFAALVIYILQRMMVLNLPLIGDFIAELIKIVNEHL